MLGLGGETLDAMMRANSLKGPGQRRRRDRRAACSVRIARLAARYRALIAEGYKAAEAMRDRLLPLAISEA